MKNKLMIKNNFKAKFGDKVIKVQESNSLTSLISLITSSSLNSLIMEKESVISSLDKDYIKNDKEIKKLFKEYKDLEKKKDASILMKSDEMHNLYYNVKDIKSKFYTKPITYYDLMYDNKISDKGEVIKDLAKRIKKPKEYVSWMINSLKDNITWEKDFENKKEELEELIAEQKHLIAKLKYEWTENELRKARAEIEEIENEIEEE